MQIVKGRHLANILRAKGMPSVGHIIPDSIIIGRNMPVRTMLAIVWLVATTDTKNPRTMQVISDYVRFSQN